MRESSGLLDPSIVRHCTLWCSLRKPCLIRIFLAHPPQRVCQKDSLSTEGQRGQRSKQRGLKLHWAMRRKVLGWGGAALPSMMGLSPPADLLRRGKVR